MKDTRICELDGVRGLAVIAVLMCHLPRGLWFGQTGVDLFFVLSGFLITGIILRNMDQPGFLKVFYWRRTLRIFPIYYLFLFAVLLVNQLKPTPVETSGIGWYFAYLQYVPSYWGEFIRPRLPIGHLWSLAIEEQFYLLWPTAIIVLGRRRTPWFAALLIILPVALRSTGVSRLTLFGHTDGLAWGALIACFADTQIMLQFKSWTVTLLVLGILVAYGCLHLSSEYSGDDRRGVTGQNIPIALVAIAYAGIVLLIYRLRGTRVAALFRNPILVKTGEISYGLYLYHLLVFELFDVVFKYRLGYQDPWWLDVLKLSVSFLVAFASWNLIEKPLLRWKELFQYGRSNRAHISASRA